jgi:hypothetical protein
MEKIIKTIKDLGVIRKVPQFLFLGGIYPISMLRTRIAIQNFKKNNQSMKEIDFIINSPGGSADDAYRIIRTLRQTFETVNIIVPFWAKSAATLLSLGGSKLIFDEFGEFGPLDVQITKEKEDGPGFERESALVDESALNRIEERSRELFLKVYNQFYNSDIIHLNKARLSKQIFEYVAKFYEPLLEQINPYKLGEKKRKLDIAQYYANKILGIYNNEIPQEKRLELVDYLVNSCPDHGFVIDYSLMSCFMTNVFKSDIFGVEYEDKLRELSNLFIQIEGSEEFTDFVGGDIIKEEVGAIESAEFVEEPKILPLYEKSL